MTKPRLAFIGHSFHKKTLSHRFLCKALEREFVVDIFWDESWDRGDRVDVRSLAETYENFLFFQTMYRRSELTAIRSKNVIYVPMYDGVWKEKQRYWLKYRRFKVVSFCHAIHRNLQRLGLESHYIKYYPPAEPAEINHDHPKPVVYFWQRVNDLTWSDVKRLFDPEEIEKVIINSSVDPGQEFVSPPKEDIRSYKIEFVSWFEKTEDYIQLLKGIDILVAPRLREGIGFSFLNAMARGKVVAAPDLPTANEYIDDETGYLFDPGHIRRLAVSDFIQKAERSYARYLEGEKASRVAEDAMLSFVRRKGSPIGRAWHVWLCSGMRLLGLRK